MQTTNAPSRWSGKRTKLAGLAGMVGGMGLLVAVFLGDAPFGAEGTLGYALWTLVIAGLFGLVVAAIVGVHARYGAAYGRLGSAVIGLFALSTTAVVISSVATVVAPQSAILFNLGDVGFFGMIPLATAAGIVLWRRTGASRLAAGLLLAVLPLALGAIALTTVIPAAEEAASMVVLTAFTLAIAALGYDLWSSETTEPVAAGASPVGR